MEDDELDAHQVDSDFEPQSRPRSCTWPLPCPEDFPGGHEVSGGLPLANIKVEPEDVPACRAGLVGGTPGELKHPAGAPAPTGATHPCLAGAALDVTGPLRKAKSSRRNAWGNQSYADLITRAIESTPDKRLTLSQIYDWMVRYVPYFKDKGDSNSSAGWKVRNKTNAPAWWVYWRVNHRVSSDNIEYYSYSLSHYDFFTPRAIHMSPWDSVSVTHEWCHALSCLSSLLPSVILIDHWWQNVIDWSGVTCCVCDNAVLIPAAESSSWRATASVVVHEILPPGPQWLMIYFHVCCQ